jgi:glycosyltransferase involved in cell wall biosynthesis
MAKLFIGMPVYNGDRFIEEAIESVLTQTYQDWELHISDNNSTDKTTEICKKFALKDDRITYVKQDENIGAVNNFLFLLDCCEYDHFMWFSADDRLDKKFIERCLLPLTANPNIRLSFCNINNIDTFGRVISHFPSFSRFVNNDKPGQIASYILDPEISGKANLIHGIYRILGHKESMKTFFRKGVNTWGVDFAFVLGVLLFPGELHIDESCLFFKRIANPSDKNLYRRKLKTEFPHLNGIPLNQEDFLPYFKLLVEVSSDSPHASLVSSLINFRTAFSNDMVGYTNKLNIDREQSLHSFGIKKLATTLAGEIRNKFVRKI